MLNCLLLTLKLAAATAPELFDSVHPIDFTVAAVKSALVCFFSSLHTDEPVRNKRRSNVRVYVLFMQSAALFEIRSLHAHCNHRQPTPRWVTIRRSLLS